MGKKADQLLFSSEFDKGSKQCQNSITIKTVIFYKKQKEKVRFYSKQRCTNFYSRSVSMAIIKLKK